MCYSVRLLGGTVPQYWDSCRSSSQKVNQVPSHGSVGLLWGIWLITDESKLKEESEWLLWLWYDCPRWEPPLTSNRDKQQNIFNEAEQNKGSYKELQSKLKGNIKLQSVLQWAILLHCFKCGKMDVKIMKVKRISPFTKLNVLLHSSFEPSPLTTPLSLCLWPNATSYKRNQTVVKALGCPHAISFTQWKKHL